MAVEMSKILIIGGTGRIGKWIVEESIKSGHPTDVLVRHSTVSDPTKAEILENFNNLGVTLIHGDVYDHETLVKAVRKVDVVISAIASMKVGEQDKIIAAIKEAGNIKRFFPSEFGSDYDRINLDDRLEFVKSIFMHKVRLRRAIEAAGIPYTYVCCNFFASSFLPSLLQPVGTRDKVIIPADGNVKGVLNLEKDIATYTIRTVDDPRTLNKILYIRPPKNIVSFNELVAIWEKLTGKTLEKTCVSDEELVKDIQVAPYPVNIRLMFTQAVFVKGDHTSYGIEPTFGVEASEVYPDVKYTSVEEYLTQVV